MSIKRGKIRFVEAASAFRQGGHSVAPMAYGYCLQPHGEQLQRPGSQEQELPHLQVAAVFRLASLRFFG